MDLTENEIREIAVALFTEFFQSRHDGPDIDDAVDNAHTHANMTAIDTITKESVDDWNAGSEWGGDW